MSLFKVGQWMEGKCEFQLEIGVGYRGNVLYDCDHEEHVDDKVYQEFMVETRSRFPLPQIEFSSAILKVTS
ncbi:hypothetical protein AX774_g7925 [Zancudomyces culisetae]|uniref:Uncharacterized protein n=1 Tax=Zancudomyces culisetae TaxID=1213189 RepID=A0A1R1PCL1_ZANCU|nr:hypothetical protein AX774_g7925 [Zancudomyces culisetae]|eukprot:OMH78681.1 hypothetical protein AX774_g7925 [Zancudomyces culisetae]